MNKITYGRQTISQDDIDEVIKALKSPAITQGEYVTAFENALKEYTGAKYAIVVSSGTAALHTAYAALGLKEYEEIITCPNT
ncbi:MAG: DegT/DnrJ/EryC1/StrS family aminotransferase, partial [Mucispirillum sp.]|nr:DegT/DnrJ/EryC1/StrS family aminotransferase [Mucispirillum sp.]